jgi:hypothetical protein
MHNEGEAILPPSDARVKRVARVSSALITALEEENKTLIYGATWPPSTTSRVNELTKVMHERERGGKFYPPSATAKNSFVPYRHDAGDPLLDLDREDWNIYVIEGVSRIFPCTRLSREADAQPPPSRTTVKN